MISNEINTINGEDKICIISPFFVELLNNDKRQFMPVVSGRHSSLFPGQRMYIAIWSNEKNDCLIVSFIFLLMFSLVTFGKMNMKWKMNIRFCIACWR